MTIDVTNCDGPGNWGIGWNGVQPAHGTLSFSGQSGSGTETVTYTQNGDAATSDSFPLEDEDGAEFTVNVTISGGVSASIAVSPPSRNEDSGAPFTYTVTLSQTRSSATVVNLSRGGTATSGTDYTGAPSSIVVPANTVSASFAVTPVADSTGESDETVVMSLASGSGYSIGSPSSATATILNDDMPAASIAVSPLSVSEDGASDLVFTVTLDQTAPNAVSIAYSLGGSATSGTDYAAVGSPLVIAAGQSSGTITIDPTADSTVEANETVVVSLSAGSGYTAGSPSSASGTILDDDTVVTVGPASLPAATAGGAYSEVLNASGGTAPYSFTVTAGALPAGLNLTGAGVLSGTPTVSGSFSFTATAIDSGSPTSGSRSYTLTVNAATPGAPTIGTASAGDGQASVSFTAAVSDGGAPITGYTVTSSPGGFTGTGSTSPITIAGLSNGTSYTFLVTATNGAGTGPASAASSAVTPVAALAAPVAGNTSTSVAASSSDNPVTLALSGGAAASVAVASHAAHGIATASGTAITYTPTAGFYGSDSFTYTATNAVGTSAPATIAVTVTAPASNDATLSSIWVGSGTLTPVFAPQTTSYAVSVPSTTSLIWMNAATTDTGATYHASGADRHSGSSWSTSLAYGSNVVVIVGKAADGTTTQTYTVTVTRAATAPTVTSTSPATGTTAGGTSVVIAGTNLTGTTAVTFDGVPASSYTVGSATQITAVAPAHAAGPVAVAVTTAGGIASLANAYTYVVSVPVAGNTSASVAANSSANPVTLPLSGGTATSVAVTGQASHGIATASGTAIVYTPVAGFSGLDSFTYAATNAAGTSAPATVTVTVNAVAPDAPTIGTALAGDGQASVSFTAPASNGGATITSYTVMSSPGGFTSTGSVSPVVVTGLANGTSYTFTVAATNSAGTGSASAASSAVTPAAALGPPIASNSTTTVAANSSATPVVLDLSGGTATSVAIASQASHGTATASGTAIVYTPVAGFSGLDSFTYAATNAAGTSGPASVAVMVGAPTLALSPGAGALPPAAVGAAYSQSFIASSGSGAYSFAISGGALPAGLTLDSTGILSGTAVAAGTASFTITVTDANGATGSAGYILVVSAAPVVVNLSPGAGSLGQGMVGTSYRLTLSATGGTAPYGFAVTSGSLPEGLSLDAASGVIAGTPTAASASSFAVTATDANGAIATGNYAIEVRAPVVAFSFSPASGALPQAMAGEAYQQSVTATGGTGTRLYNLASGTLPDGLVLNLSTGELNGPLKAGTEGDYNFTVAVTDGSGETGTASYTLRVAPQVVTVTDKTMTVAPGELPGNVYLNAGATGGPFVSADLARIEPTNAGTAQIIEGEVAALETVRPRGFYLKFTPNPLFAGTASIDFTLTSALGVSNTGTVTYTVAVDRAAVVDRADRAVRDFVSARQSLLSNHVAVPGLVERRLTGRASERGSLKIAPNGNGVGVNVATSTAQIEAVRRSGDPAAADAPMPLLNVWFDGTFLAHKQGSSGSRDEDALAPDTGTDDDGGNWGSFALLSAGVDYLVSDRLLVGVALHSDRMSDPGEGTHVEGTGILAGPYASLALSPSLYLDASLLYGQSWNSVDLDGFDGDFDTTRLMTTTKLEGFMGSGAWTFRPNLKLNYLTEKVEDYDVSGEDVSVAVKGFTEDDLRFSAGLTVGYAMTLANGWTLAPELGGSLGLSSADANKTIGDGLFGTLHAGFGLAGGSGWTLQAMGTADMGRDGAEAVGGQVSISVPF